MILTKPFLRGIRARVWFRPDHREWVKRILGKEPRFGDEKQEEWYQIMDGNDWEIPYMEIGYNIQE